MNNIKDKIKESYGNAIIKHNRKFISQKEGCCQTLDRVSKKNLSTPSFGLLESLAYSFVISPGDIVVDLGAGAGHDVFKVAELVGSKGRVIGIDFTYLFRIRISLFRKGY